MWLNAIMVVGSLVMLGWAFKLFTPDATPRSVFKSPNPSPTKILITGAVEKARALLSADTPPVQPQPELTLVYEDVSGQNA